MKMKIKSYLTTIGATLIMTSIINAVHSFEPEYEGGYPTIKTANENFEQAIADYIQKVPYQDSYNYAVRYTGSDPSKLNIWVVGAEPTLVKAGEDKIVRMNNDTYYKMAVVVLNQGPVVLAAEQPTDGRFVSFQLMDDRNVNFRNVIHPNGKCPDRTKIDANHSKTYKKGD